jgi:hypothetical protein
MRRFLALAVLSVALVAAAATSAAAVGPPTGGCPVGFDLYPESVLSQYPLGGLQGADLNGDDQTCIKWLDTPTELVFVDNVVPVSSG